MATGTKRARQASKRAVSCLLIAAEENNERALQCVGDLADDHDFLAPYEICFHAIGLLFCLTIKRLIGISFSTLYERSQKRGWLDLLTRERRNLKPNVNSIEKCFMLNRLINAEAKVQKIIPSELRNNQLEFAQQATQLHEEIKTSMTCRAISFSTKESLYEEIQNYQTLQCQRRLFYINHEEAKQPQNLLSLQGAISKLWLPLIKSCEKNANYLREEGKNDLTKLLQHSFIIVIQPSTAECVAAAKYEKFGNTYTVKLNSRIICLLDVDEIDAQCVLSNLAVTLYSLDRQVNEEGEIQSTLEWKKRTITDQNDLSRSFYYAELQAIKLTKPDTRSVRPFYSSKLCQLHFHLKIRMKKFAIEENLTFLSRPFGLCSHAQYFPEYVAKVLIYEVEQMPQITDRQIPPNTITDFMCRYHTRITGIEPKPHTREFILQQLQATYEMKKTFTNFTSVEIYEEILSKLINQIECFADHPYLSMMYYDNLFLGICDNKIDHELTGTLEEPQILLRFNALAEHHSSQQASVRYIVHNGQLVKATFHNKAFVDEMCRMICESTSDKAKSTRILSAIPNRYFHDFNFYFDNELYRLSTIPPPTKETYNPLIPVLWSTMRSTRDRQSTQVPSSPSSDVESYPSYISLYFQSVVNRSINKSSAMANGTFTLQTDNFIDYLVGKLSEICLNFQIPVCCRTEQCAERKQRIVSDLLRDYLQTMSQVQASSTETINKQNATKSYSVFCSTSTNI